MSEPTDKDIQLQIRQLESQLLDNEIDAILLKLACEAGVAAISGKTIDTMPYARRIVAFCREHI